MNIFQKIDLYVLVILFGHLIKCAIGNDERSLELLPFNNENENIYHKVFSDHGFLNFNDKILEMLLKQSHKTPILVIVYAENCMFCKAHNTYIETFKNQLNSIGIQSHSISLNNQNRNYVKKLNVGKNGLFFAFIIDSKIYPYKYDETEYTNEPVDKEFELYENSIKSFPLNVKNFYDKIYGYRMNMYSQLNSYASYPDSYFSVKSHSLINQVFQSVTQFMFNLLTKKYVSNYNDHDYFPMLDHVYNWTINDFFRLPDSFYTENKVNLLVFHIRWYKRDTLRETLNNVLDSDRTKHMDFTNFIIRESVSRLKFLILAYYLRRWTIINHINIYYPIDTLQTNCQTTKSDFTGLLSKFLTSNNLCCSLLNESNRFSHSDYVLKVNSVTQILRFYIGANDSNSCKKRSDLTPIIKFSPFFESSNNSNYTFIQYALNKLIDIPNDNNKYLPDTINLLAYPNFARLSNARAFSHICPFVKGKKHKIDNQATPVTWSGRLTFCSLVLFNQSVLNQYVYNHNPFDSLSNGSNNSNNLSVLYKLFLLFENMNELFCEGNSRANCSFKFGYASLEKQGKFLNSFVPMHSNLMSTQSKKITFNSFIRQKIEYLKESSPNTMKSHNDKSLTLYIPILTLIRLPLGEYRYRVDVVFYNENHTEFDMVDSSDYALFSTLEFPNSHTYTIVKNAVLEQKENLETNKHNEFNKYISQLNFLITASDMSWAMNSFGYLFYSLLRSSTLTQKGILYRHPYVGNSVSSHLKDNDYVGTNSGTNGEYTQSMSNVNQGLYRYFFMGRSGLNNDQEATYIDLSIFFPYVSLSKSPPIPPYKSLHETKKPQSHGQNHLDTTNLDELNFDAKTPDNYDDYYDDVEFEKDLIIPNHIGIKIRLQDSIVSVKKAIIDSHLEDIVDEQQATLLQRSLNKAKSLIINSDHINTFVNGVKSRVATKRQNFNKDDVLTMLSVIFSFVFVLGGGYFMAYLVKVEEDKVAEEIRAHPIKLPNRIINHDMIFHELKPGTYNALVRLLKPGCRTILIFLDEDTKDQLLEKFSRILYPYRKNVSLMFGFVMIGKYLSWYRRLLLQVIGYGRKLEINPKNCVGTVLVVNGYRKYYCIFHARHYEASFKNSISSLSISSDNPSFDYDLDGEGLSSRINGRSESDCNIKKRVDKCDNDGKRLDTTSNLHKKMSLKSSLSPFKLLRVRLLSNLNNGVNNNSQNLNVSATDPFGSYDMPQELVSLETLMPEVCGMAVESKNANREKDISKIVNAKSINGLKEYHTPPPSYSSLYMLTENDSNGVATTNPQQPTIIINGTNFSDTNNLTIIPEKSSDALAKTSEKNTENLEHSHELFLDAPTPNRHSSIISDKSGSLTLSSPILPLPFKSGNTTSPAKSLLCIERGTPYASPSSSVKHIAPISSMADNGTTISEDLNQNHEFSIDTRDNQKRRINQNNQHQVTPPNTNRSRLENASLAPKTTTIADQLLKDFPAWLDRLFEGNVQRYYIEYWPPMKI